MHPTLGIQLIIKDESDVIRACLESVQHADEIIVLDTGSRDDSPHIAAQYGAKVFETSWHDDFSAARNEALDHAETDWILVMDADEQLLSPLHEVRRWIEDPLAEAFDVTIISLLDTDKEQAMRHRSLRLFRNRQEYRFQGIIHEEIEPSIFSLSGQENIKASNIELQHTGYQQPNMTNKHKLQRNYRILTKALEKDPGNPYYLYHLGITHCQGGDLTQAKKYMLEAKQLAPAMAAFRPTLIRDLGKIMLARQEPEEACLLCLRELQHYSDYADLHYIHAESLESQGLWEQAFEAYRDAAACSFERYVTEEGIEGYKPLSRMGELALKLNRPEESARLFHEAALLFTGYPPAICGLAAAFHRLDTADREISSLLLSIVRPSNPKQWSLILTALDRIGADEEIYRLCPPERIADPGINSVYGPALLRLSKYKEANSYFFHAACVNKAHAPEREMLHLLTQWQMTDALDPSIRTFLRELPLEPVDWISERLASSKEDSMQLAETRPEYAGLIEQLIHLSVAVGCFDLARKLSGIEADGKSQWAKCLYREGYTLEAADLLISLLESQTLDDEGAHMLAEILHDKGHYDEAVRLFDHIVLHDPSRVRSSIGAAVCYLHLAADSLEKGDSASPGWSVLSQEAAQLQSAIRQLDRSGWHTAWNDRQRRHGHDSRHDQYLPLHDRQE